MFIKLILFATLSSTSAAHASACQSTLEAKPAHQLERQILIQKGWDADIVNRLLAYPDPSFKEQLLHSNQMPQINYRGIKISLDQYNPTYGDDRPYAVYLTPGINWPIAFASPKGLLLRFQVPTRPGVNSIRAILRKPFYGPDDETLPDDRLFLESLCVYDESKPNPCEWISYREAVSQKMLKDF